MRVVGSDRVSWAPVEEAIWRAQRGVVVPMPMFVLLLSIKNWLVKKDIGRLLVIWKMALPELCLNLVPSVQAVVAQKSKTMLPPKIPRLSAELPTVTAWPAPAVPTVPILAFSANRLVEEAVVEKRFVVVALVVVE